MLSLAIFLLALLNQEGSGSLEIQNYALAGMHADGLREEAALFDVYEATSGVDLNGDGDLQDFVLHLVEADGAVIHNLMVDARESRLSPGAGTTLALAVWETGSGLIDLNGDGDAIDEVLFLYDVPSGVTTLTGLAIGQIAGDSVRWWGDDLLFTAREQVQLGQDFNGDGDSLDQVLCLWDASTGTITFSGLGTKTSLERGSYGTAGEWVVLVVDEKMQGEDLDGDGTQTGSVAHAWSPASAAVVNLGFRPQDVQGLDALDVALRDAAAPHALHVFDAVTGTSRVVRASTTPLLPLATAGRRVLFLDGETSTDLNGDGDVEPSDHVVCVEEPAAGLSTTLPFAAADLVVDGPFAAFLLDEAAQQVDANEDGDQLDTVLHVVDLLTLSIRNLRLAVTELSDTPFGPNGLDRETYLKNGLLPFRCAEAELGLDLNGDGDQDDTGLVAWEFLTGKLLRSPIVVDAGSAPAFSSDEHVVLCARNEADDQNDWNGDGDTSDNVFALWHACTNAAFDTGLAGQASAPGDVARRAFLVDVPESAQGGVDLDGNGLATDLITHRVALLAPVGTTRRFGAGTAGTGGVVPRLSSLGCPEPGGLEGFFLERGRGGAVALLVAGRVPQNLPLVGGTLYVFPFELTLGFTLTGSATVGIGEALVVPGPIDVNLAGSTFLFQAAVLDPEATSNVALSNALQVDLGQ